MAGLGIRVQVNGILWLVCVSLAAIAEGYDRLCLVGYTSRLNARFAA
jgi:hypothetical protein